MRLNAGKCYVMDKCLASYHARNKVHDISYCARDIARSQAIISSENKKKEEHEHYLPDSVFFFSLIYFHFIIWASLFYFSHYYCHKNRILPFGCRPREKPLVFT